MPVEVHDSEFVLVPTTKGMVRGRWRVSQPASPTESSSASAAFLGIPFAQPPTGTRRFAAPQPMEPWEGVLDALEYGATPLRDDSGETLIPEPAIPGDSTLNVNVFTPRPADSDAKLPVMVWIHGGAFTAGSPASPWYDGATFNRDGVVVVTVSYRLGFQGFGLIKGAPANRGVLDWLAALRWVQDNIASFGGDPSQVTIAGQSAGGGAVLTLLGMEQAQSLFARALCISGVLADVRKRDALKATRRLCEYLHTPPTASALSEIPEETLLEAQEHALALKHLRDYVNVLSEGMNVGPVIDGKVLTRPTLDSLRAGVGSDKPLLLGANDDEFSTALTGQARLVDKLPRRAVAAFLGLRGETYQAYAAANQEVSAQGTAHLLGRFVTDKIFRTAVVRVLHARGASPTWSYRFTATQPQSGLSIHCLDVPFWFDCLDGPNVENLTGPTPSRPLAQALHRSAVRFFTSGNPGWARWTPARPAVEVFGDNLEHLELADEATLHVTTPDAYRGAEVLLPSD